MKKREENIGSLPITKNVSLGRTINHSHKTLAPLERQHVFALIRKKTGDFELSRLIYLALLGLK